MTDIAIPVLIRVHPDDDVAVAMADVAPGTVPFEGAELIVSEPVARGHKVALNPLAAGDPVRRYGFPIGRATAPIARGAGVHVHNVATGLAGEDPSHLFTKFYRAGNARKARPDGTGLGLFMAKKVIVAQGGAIIFKSDEGKGSTFGFTFSKAKLASLQKSDPSQTTTT